MTNAGTRNSLHSRSEAKATQLSHALLQVISGVRLSSVNGSDSNARVGAVELLTNRVNSEALFANPPKNWQDMNFQAVIETRTGNNDQVSSKVLVITFGIDGHSTKTVARS